MKLVKLTDDRFELKMTPQEKGLFCEILKRYPSIPTDHAQLSKAGGMADSVSAQHLLEEALADDRKQARTRLDKFLDSPDRFQQTEKTVKLLVEAVEIDWLLRVLNEIRVGSWLKLGSPVKSFDLTLLNEETAPDFWAMEITGHFQAVMLDALS